MPKDTFDDVSSLFSSSDNGLSFGVFVNELVATVVFFTVLLKLDDFTDNHVLTGVFAAMGLFAGLLIDGNAHMNPAVSLMMCVQGKMNGSQMMVELVAQVLAIFIAGFLVKSQQK